MQISYKDIFKVAWQITLKNRMLWLLGLFASFISLENIYEVIINQIQRAKNLQILQQNIVDLYPDQSALLNKHVYFLNLVTNNYQIYLFFILIIVLIILFIWLVFTSQIYLIKSVECLYKNKKIVNAEIFDKSHGQFWSVLSINLLAKIFLYAGFIALSLPLLYLILSQKTFSLIIADILFFIVYIIFAVVVSFLTAYATNFIVLKNLNVLTAIKEAWGLFSRNIIISLEIASILFIFKIVSFIFVLCLFFLVLIPLLIVLLYALATNSLLGFIMSVTLIILFFLLIYFLIAAIFTIFYLASWTICFIKLTEETIWAKIIHYLKNIPALFKKAAQQFNLQLDKKEMKKQSLKLAKETQKEAKILSNKLFRKYEELEPKAKKQGKIMAKELKAAYLKFEPKVKRKIKKIISQRKKEIKKQQKAEKITPKRPKRKRKTVKK